MKVPPSEPRLVKLPPVQRNAWLAEAAPLSAEPTTAVPSGEIALGRDKVPPGKKPRAVKSSARAGDAPPTRPSASAEVRADVASSTVTKLR